MRLRSSRTRFLSLATIAGLGVPLMVVAGAGSPAQGKAVQSALPLPSYKQMRLAHGETEGRKYLKARERYFQSRYLSGTHPLSPEQAGRYRAKAAKAALASRGKQRDHALRAANADTSAPWSSIGPEPINEVTRSTGSLEPMSGRVSALAVKADGTIYLGAAQGGLWKRDPITEEWSPLTNSLPNQSVGAVTLAPSNPNIIYLATGEGDLSGDSYYGDGVWRSTNGGDTWTHVSGTQFPATSITRLLVDPTNSDIVYVATIRGRGGSLRVSPPTDQVWGIYKSTNGGVDWKLLKGTKDANHGATDLEFDPNNRKLLYASFWKDGIYKSTPAGNWQNISQRMPINPGADFSDTRFSIATAPLSGGRTRIYAGFDWYNHGQGAHRNARIFRSDDGGTHWQQMPYGTAGDVDSVFAYCGEQCSYDNVVEVDPNDPDIIYAGGSYNYALEVGGIYRSLDGGETWKTLGLDLHPDYHALAFEPDNTEHIVVGNDGGVWESDHRGGRLEADDPLTAVEWNNLNEGGLSTVQFDSIDFTTDPDSYWGGTQDNGTEVTVGGPTWYDVTSGDGGNVVVDHTNSDFVFGTYYLLTGLYRFQDGGDFFTNANIMNGINLDDRSEFYIPLAQNEGNTNQLLTGTYRVYRSDNAETPVAADVQWQPISGDLTSGCTGAASNGGRGCTVSSLGVSDGGAGAYAGTEEGWVWSADDAMTSDGDANWVRSSDSDLPGRPVAAFAVDRSDWRSAYVAFAGYNAATPNRPGHVFRTTDGGQTWSNVTGNLPDNPVDQLEVDPSNPNRVYAGTDVGPYVTEDGGDHWTFLGTAIPVVNIWGLSYDPSRGLLVAGTHGRGGYTLDTGVVAPAMVAQVSDPGLPVGPGSDIPYTLTIRNVGSQDATGVTVTQPTPANTTVHTTDGTPGSSGVTWSVPTVAAGDSVDLHLTVTIDPNLPGSVDEIVSDGLAVTTNEGPGTRGSPHVVPISPEFSATLSPASEVRTAQLGTDAAFRYTLTNSGYRAEAFDLSAVGNTWETDLQPDCGSTGNATTTLDPGESVPVCVDVSVPSGAAEHASQTFTLTASPQLSSDTADDATATGTTVAITKPVLLVDQDGDAPDVQSYYTAALTSANVQYDVWDLAADPDLEDGYLNGYDEVYWFAGTSWPNPLAPYEKGLKTYLDAGGKLFMSGMDILDQSGGTTPFASNYLHVDWDGSDDQNDIATEEVHSVGTSIGGPAADYPLTVIDGFCACLDQITPVPPAAAQFTDDAGEPNALAVTDTSGATGSSYKVVFLAFPFEEMGTPGDRAALVTRTESYFGAP